MAPETMTKAEDLAKVVSSLSPGDDEARRKAIRLCDDLKQELERPNETLLRTFWAQPSHHLAIRLGVQWGLFDTLNQDGGSPKTCKQLAASSGADPDLILRFVRHLAAMGTLHEVDVGTFANTTFSKHLTARSSQDLVTFMYDDMSPVIWKTPAFFATTNNQTPTDINNTVAQYALNMPGKSWYQYMGENPTIAIRFGSMMGAYAAGRPVWWEEGYYPVQERLGHAKSEDSVLLVDIGGGTGGDLAKFRAAHPSLKGRLVLQDLPHIVDQSKDLGFEVMSHDWNQPQPIKNARGYMLHHIIHDYGSDDDCRHILSQIIPAMETGYSKLLVKDLVVPDKGADWLMSALDIEVLQGLAGKERTESQWKALLESAGLKIEAIFKHEKDLDSVIECVLA